MVTLDFWDFFRNMEDSFGQGKGFMERYSNIIENKFIFWQANTWGNINGIAQDCVSPVH